MKKINSLELCYSDVNVHGNHLGIFLKNANSDLVGLVWAVKFCSSNQLPGDAAAVGPRTKLCEARV